MSSSAQSNTEFAPAPEVLASWDRLSQAIDWAGLRPESWSALATAMGEPAFDDIATFAGLEDEDFIAVRHEAKLPLLQKAAANRLFYSVKLKYGLVTKIIAQTPTTTVPTTTAITTTAQLSNEGETKFVAKVKLGQILNQAFDQEIPMLTCNKLKAARDRYNQLCGDDPLANIDVSDSQLTALQFVLSNDITPYADFAIFGPHGARHERRLKFAQHFMDSGGSWRTVEQPGPASLDQWLQSWETFSVAAIMLNIASPATLQRYSQRFQQRTKVVPNAWHVCVVAEDRCRAEQFPVIKRKQERFADSHPMITDFKSEMPWETVFREATESHEYWSTALTEPAMVYMTARGLHGASVPTSSGDVYNHQKGKRDWTQAIADHESAGAIKRQGLYITDQAGREICLSYNRGTCKGCRRSHVCEYCLSEHRGCDKICTAAKKGAGKGKHKRRGGKGQKGKGEKGSRKVDKE